MGTRSNDARWINDDRAFAIELRCHVDHHARHQHRDGQRDDRAKQQRRPEARVEEARPHVARLRPPARRELPRKNAVDPEQAHPRGQAVQHEQCQARTAGQNRPVAVEEIAGHDFQTEERPLGRPDPVKLVDHHADGARADLDGGEPHAHAGERADDEGDQHERSKITIQEIAGVRRFAALGVPLEIGEQHAAADRELRDEDMEDAHAADDDALHERPEVADGIIRWRHLKSKPTAPTNASVRFRNNSSSG